MLRILLTGVQIFSSLAIIGLVLLQRGKGADAGAGFGAGASGTVFGARGASTALSRATAIFAAVFMINSLALTYMGERSAPAAKSILDEAGETSRPGVGAGASSHTTTIPTPAPAPATPATGPSPVPANPAQPAGGSSGTPPAGETPPK